MGYVGPGVVSLLRTKYPSATLVGYDMGYFANCLTNADFFPESQLDLQLFGDIRLITAESLEGTDAIVHLAAISNDPMSNKFEEVTLDVNYKCTIALAKMAKEAGVKSFVFASSCSMYGYAEDDAKTENSPLNPLTAYARSKVLSEQGLEPLAGNNFIVTCLRFATACGMSNRLRLDLVLNDFVAGAVANKQIAILSDGSPWRPLINVKDMARAIDWAITRESSNGGEFLAVNAGSSEWNYQVKDLAQAVAQVIPDVKISINQNAPADKRSYRVNFDLFKKLAPAHQPACNLISTIEELKHNLEEMQFDDKEFRNSQLMRLKVLDRLQAKKLITDKLEWVI
jgi:nucleoside-diphosphate-sugar epimerase